MQTYWILLRRELGGYFVSPSGYFVIATVLMLLGLSFVDMLTKLNVEATDAPVTEQFFVTLYFWLILLLTAPVMTMRSFASEKGSGTYETLMTAPVSDAAVVLAKFSGSLAFYLLTWLPFAGYLLLVHQYAGGDGPLDWKVLASTYAGLALVGGVYMALGCFASALTRSPIVAVMTSYALGLALFLLSLRSLTGGPAEGWVAMVFAYIGMPEHMENFARGIVDSRAIVFYLTLTVLFLFLTHKVVESRRWK